MIFKTESRFANTTYRLVTACLFLVGCFFTIRSLQPDVPSTMASASAEIQGSSSLGAMDAGGTRSGSESTVELVTTNIEDIRLGQRVVGTNPLREQTQPASDINPATWRAVELVMHEAGIQYDLAFLRPLSWIEATRAVEGGAIHLELDEMGLNGPAQVTAINPCPEIEADDGTGRNVVTGTMAHPGPNILYLDITGLEEPLGVTDTHPMWSETRQDFVVAGQLEVGEQFRTLTGESATLTAIHPHRGPPEMVFNLEVDGQHVYSVAGTGLLAHNACNPLRENMKANGTVFEAGEQAGHIVPKKGWAWGGDELQAVIKKVTDAGLIHDVANGFKAIAGHLGTHKKTYVKDLIEEMQNRVSVEEIKEGMANMLKKILAEDYT